MRIEPGIALPRRSRTAICLAIVGSLVLLGWYIVMVRPPAWMWLPIFLVSGLIADAITAALHFCFDYVIPFNWPVLGPIAWQFNEHHDDPALDPRELMENFTKGGYGSVLACLLAISLLAVLPADPVSIFFQGISVVFCFWALVFHQMHSFAHMGSVLPTEVFCRRVAAIEGMADVAEQRRWLRELFATVPIPPTLRLLQRLGLVLSPERHNLHHVRFERDFSSLNGWSNPLLNLLFTPLARRLKPRRTEQLLARGWAGRLVMPAR